MPTDSPAAPQSNSSSNRRNLALFGLLCVVAAAGVIGYAVHSRGRSARPAGSGGSAIQEDAQKLAATQRRPHLLFRHTALGPLYGRLAVAALDDADGARFATPLSCDRVYGASGAGVCLQANRDVVTTYQGVSFDQQFRVVHTFKLAGVPSRTRVSRDGRRAAVTVFVSGDSYTTAGFSTRTTLFDLNSGKVIGDLEQFAVKKEGKGFKAVDFNFWGVTFAKDGERFYATLSTGGKSHLVEGRVSTREMTVLREGVECPSLSPNGARVVYKSRTTEGGRLIWRLHVLDLKTKTETIVNEPHSVDDQTEWFDDEQVLYALPQNVPGSGSADVWIARADGTGTPRVFAHDAISPCVVRP